jgi:hypothetical protein
MRIWEPVMLSAAKHLGILAGAQKKMQGFFTRFALFRMTGGWFYAPTYRVGV